MLGEISENMGAIHRLDLTTDVTHLIVGQIDTPKYKHVAKERPEIRVLRPEWIQAMRDAWTSGDDFDVDTLVEQYRLPALYGLQICVTGFDDLEQRQHLIWGINEQGGTYNGDLTKIVTHLIAKKPEGAKYDRAKQWGLRIVSLKWFQESLERDMALEEALYDPLRPGDMQGQGAFMRGFERETALGKRSREQAASVLAQENGKRKLRRTMSARLSTHSQSLWAELSAVEDIKPIKTEYQWDSTSQTFDGINLGPMDDAGSSASTPTVSGAEISRPVSRGTFPVVEQKRGLFSACLFLVTGHSEQRVCLTGSLISLGSC